MLFIVLNRFLFDASGTRKDCTYVAYRRTLLIGGRSYTLKSVIFHHGGYIHSGHYTLETIINEQTLVYDDEVVHVRDLASICSKRNDVHAYILLYVSDDQTAN